MEYQGQAPNFLAWVEVTICCSCSPTKEAGVTGGQPLCKGCRTGKGKVREREKQ